MEQKNKTEKFVKIPLRLLVLAALLVALGIIIWGISASVSREPQRPTVETIATLERAVKISKLSTSSAVYNGVAVVNNTAAPALVDYYVSYKATVDTGIDFSEITFAFDHDTLELLVTMPRLTVFEPKVDISSLDYIFVNRLADRSTVTMTSYPACEADALAECRNNPDIYSIAKRNAENTVHAFIDPFLSDLARGYTLRILWQDNNGEG